MHVLACGLIGLALAACAPAGSPAAGRSAGDPVRFASARDWKLEAKYLSPQGSNPLYGPLRPGFRYVLGPSADAAGSRRVEVMVLEQTEPFDLPGIGRFDCAVVQTEELEDGMLERQVQEWLAVDTRTKAIYTFGAVSWEVDSSGTKVFAGMWRAGDGEEGHVAEPAMVMPGRAVKGERQRSVARGSGADGYSEVMETGVQVEAPAGRFEDCVRIRQFTLREPDAFTDRWWSPKVGLVRDGTDGGLVASDALKSDLSGFGQHTREKAAPQAQAGRITPEQAKAIALKEVPGTFRDIVLEQRGSVLVYTVEIIAKADGVETDVFIDVVTGKVVATER
jgi:hypothetical protein